MSYNDDVMVIVVRIIINLVNPLSLCFFHSCNSDAGFVLVQMADLLRYY